MPKKESKTSESELSFRRDPRRSIKNEKNTRGRTHKCFEKLRERERTFPPLFGVGREFGGRLRIISFEKRNDLQHQARVSSPRNGRVRDEKRID